jgi:hypothetical protein
MISTWDTLDAMIDTADNRAALPDIAVGEYCPAQSRGDGTLVTSLLPLESGW